MSANRLAEVGFDGSSPDVVYATVNGEIDDSNAGELERALTDRVTPAARMLAIDLSAVAYIDSTGVELLFGLARRLQARRQSLTVIAPIGSGVRRVLELCDVGSVAALVQAPDEIPAGQES